MKKLLLVMFFIGAYSTFLFSSGREYEEARRQQELRELDESTERYLTTLNYAIDRLTAEIDGLDEENAKNQKKERNRLRQERTRVEQQVESFKRNDLTQAAKVSESLIIYESLKGKKS